MAEKIRLEILHGEEQDRGRPNPNIIFYHTKMAGIKRKEAPKPVSAQTSTLKKKQKLATPGLSKKKAAAKEEFPESDTTEDDEVDELDGEDFPEDASMSDADDDSEGVSLKSKKTTNGNQDGADGDKKFKRAQHDLECPIPCTIN